MSTASAPSRRFEGRVAVVAGASRGLGAAVAEALAREGAQVVLVARTQGALEAVDDRIRRLGGAKAVLAPFDLADSARVDLLGQAIHQRFERLDALYAGAATLAPLSPLGHIQPQHWDQSMAVNLTAQWRLVRSLDPLLRLSDAGRAVFVTAGEARTAPAYWGSYAIAKAGLEALVRIYAAEVEHTKVRANLFDPGPFRSRLRAQAFPGEDPGTLPDPASLTGPVLDLLDPACARNGELVKAG